SRHRAGSRRDSRVQRTMALLSAQQWVGWGWVSDHRALVRDRLREHVALTVMAVGIGIVIAAPLVVISRRWRGAYPVVLTTTGILYTIPSLALLKLPLPWTGLTRTTA